MLRLERFPFLERIDSKKDTFEGVDGRSLSSVDVRLIV